MSCLLDGMQGNDVRMKTLAEVAIYLHVLHSLRKNENFSNLNCTPVVTVKRSNEGNTYAGDRTTQPDNVAVWVITRYSA